MPSNFTVVLFQRQRRDPRRARTDPSATPGRNRDVVMAAILATFTWGGTSAAAAQRA
jgi:hypothetical protein